MLSLIYSPAMPGPPARYGDAVDTLAVRTAAGDAVLQSFPKADPTFRPPGPGLAATIDAWLAGRADKSAPVVVLVHGYLYDPRVDSENSPFATCYAVPGAARPFNLSWLPLAGECDETGVALADNAIAFVYQSQASMGEFSAAGWDNSYQMAVFDLAPLAGRALAAILAEVGAHDGVTVRVLAHSLGTRTTSQAVRALRTRMPAGIDRMVLLDGAEFSVDAAVNFAGCPFDVVNIVNRDDTVLTLGATQMCHPFRPNGALAACVIGRDGLGGNPRWLDLRIDDPVTVAWLADRHAPGGQAYVIAHLAEEESHPQAWLDHWACYTNAGNRAFIHDLLFGPAMTVASFVAHGPPPLAGCPANGTFGAQTIPAVPGDFLTRRRMLTKPDEEHGRG